MDETIEDTYQDRLERENERLRAELTHERFQREQAEAWETDRDVERWKVPPCIECGAETPEQAETMCCCGGDKDDCHGTNLWPDAA